MRQIDNYILEKLHISTEECIKKLKESLDENNR